MGDSGHEQHGDLEVDRMGGRGARDVAVDLDSARRDRRTLDAAAVDVGDLTAAYAVQRALTSLRLARGGVIVGWKLGYTTAAMREQMGIDSPNYGPLLDSMQIHHGVLPVELLQPRVEPEIALVLAADPGRGASAQRVLASCRRAVLALEVVDSVWSGYRFDLEHNTADGSSAAGYVLGEEIPLTATAVVVELLVDTVAEHEGRTRAVLDGSGTLVAAADGVAWLADRLHEDGLQLRAGDVVLTGGLTRATSVEPGSVARAHANGPGFSANVSVQGAPRA